MIGRDRELTRAELALDEAASGMIALVVEGEAGIGIGFTKVTVYSNGPLIGVVQGAGNGWSTSVLVQGYHGKQTPLLYVRAICIEVL